MPSHYKGTRSQVTALNAFINFARASDSLLTRISNKLEAEGFTMGQFGVMEALFHLGPMCQKELGEKLLKSGGNITVVIDNLEKRGWVRREQQTDDRRKFMVHLTAAGRRVIAEVFPRHAAMIAKEMSRLDAAEQETLRGLCRKLGRGEKFEKQGTIGREK